MHNIDSWDFNVWEYKEDELLLCALEMFSPFLSLFSSEKSLEIFLRKIKDNYHENPYHNFRHALDVGQFVYKLEKDGILKKKFEAGERFSLILAAFCHDLGHPGKNNNYQKIFHTDLYKRFGEISTLEKYHIHLLLELLKDKNAPLLPQKMEPFFTEAILATDMSLHEECMKKIARKAPLYLSMLILKCADLGQLIRPPYVSKHWVGCLHEELSLQRVEEKARGVEDSLSDAAFTEKQIASQQEFIEKTALPLFKELGLAFPELQNLWKRIKTS